MEGRQAKNKQKKKQDGSNVNQSDKTRKFLQIAVQLRKEN